MVRPVVGLMLPTAGGAGQQPRRVLETARRAEAAGFDGVYVGDHLVHPRPLLESVVTLTAVAASTPRISVGTCVLLVALRQPLVLAKQLATLAAFAPGRLRVGVGVGGEYPPEFAAVGVPLDGRGSQLERALGELRALLGGRPVAVGGDHPPVTIAPAANGNVPFLLGGWRQVALRRAARCGDGWIGYLLAPDSFCRRRNYLQEQRAELGLPWESFTTGMLLPVQPDADRRGAARRAAAGWSRITATGGTFPDRLFVAGPPDVLVEGLRRYWEAGCRELVLSIVDDGDRYLDHLDVLATEVLPALRAFGSEPGDRASAL